MKWASIIAITLIIGVIGITRWFANRTETPPAVPRGADADDMPAGATTLIIGNNGGSLSPTDTVDYWKITIGGLDMIKVAISTSECNFTVYDGNLAELHPTEISYQAPEVNPESGSTWVIELMYTSSQFPWDPQQAFYVRVINNSMFSQDYVLTVQVLSKTQSINDYVIQFAIIFSSCVVLMIITQFSDRKVVNPLEQMKKRRPLLFATLIVPAVLITWQYFQISQLYIQVDQFYRSSRLIVEEWVFLLSAILIAAEIILASLNLGKKKRIPYILARNFTYFELVLFVFYSIVILGNYAPGSQFAENREVVLVFPILCINYFLHKKTLASYGQSFGVFSFRKDKKIGRIFTDLYEREELVPITKIMDDFCFEPKRVRKAQIQLMKVLHAKVIPGDYNEKSKVYFPKERSAAQKALQKMAIDQKKRLFGILKTMGQIHFREDQKFIGLTQEEIVGMVKDLQEKGIVEGTFEGDTFVLKSDVNDFITKLEKSFSEWTSTIEAGEGKKT